MISDTQPAAAVSLRFALAGLLERATPVDRRSIADSYLVRSP
jgi:hypothetical protein